MKPHSLGPSVLGGLPAPTPQAGVPALGACGAGSALCIQGAQLSGAHQACPFRVAWVTAQRPHVAGGAQAPEPALHGVRARYREQRSLSTTWHDSMVTGTT